MGSSTRRQGRPWHSVYSTPPWHRVKVAKNNPLLATSKVCWLDFSICPVCGSHLGPLEKPRLQLSLKRLLYLTLPRLWGGGWGAGEDSTHPWEPQRHSVSSLPLLHCLHPSLDAGVKGWHMVASGQETKDGGGKQG